MRKGLVILQIDGLSYDMLQRAIRRGFMPHLSAFIKTHHFQINRYRCGLPSTTPYCQAGMLYGDSSNIPGFRWWDRKSKTIITFGSQTTFQKVAHNYFTKNPPLIENGACIAACYSAGASEAFTLSYKEQRSMHTIKLPVTLILRWMKNPMRIVTWVLWSFYMISLSFIEFMRVAMLGRHIAFKYFLNQVFNELFIHHITRFAIVSAIQRQFPIIFAGFYTYDELSHALGPTDIFCYKTLLQIDKSIAYITKKSVHNKFSYDFVILSDHGNVPTIPFITVAGETLADKIRKIMPDFSVEEVPADNVLESNNKTILLVCSGQMVNLYFKHALERLTYEQLTKKHQVLLTNLRSLNEIAFIMVKAKDSNVILTKNETVFFTEQKINSKIKKILQPFDDPVILAKQLVKLNHNEAAGDILIFGAYHGKSQITFEDQSGSHSSFGGEQMFPFILTKKSWKIDTQNIFFSEQLYPILSSLKNR